MNLSKNFTLNELLRSDTANRLKIVEQYTPSQAVVENLRKLCINILQPLRNHLGVPIRITSGFRCKRTNKAVGSKSQKANT
jgi:zinc D-Ala-D-Ala carboxypeptidase